MSTHDTHDRDVHKHTHSTHTYGHRGTQILAHAPAHQPKPHIHTQKKTHKQRIILCHQQIEGGRLWFQQDCDNTLGIMGISGRPISDGRWHAVALELTQNYTLLSLDDSYVERRRAARAPIRLWPLASDSSFFFGAQVRPPGSQAESQGQGPGPGERAGGTRVPPRAQDGFQGCLSSLVLNGNELPLQNKRSRYAEIAGLSEVKLGCVLYPDPCVNQPCLNGAICNSLPSGGVFCVFVSVFH